MLSNNNVSLEGCITKFKKIMKINTEISHDVFLSCVLDYTYFYNMTVCKNTPLLFEKLTNQPPLKLKTYLVKYPISQKDLLDKAHELISDLERNKLHQQQKDRFYKKFGIFLNSNEGPEKSKCNVCLDIDPLDFRRVYLDYNATTNIRPEVKKILQYYINNKIGFENPSSNTAEGKYQKDLIFKARQQISSDLSVKPENITFTGSGSESNNLAIKGVAFKRLKEKGHIITSKIEHASVLETMKFLSNIGFEITYLDVDKKGLVSPKLVKNNIKKNTFLVSIMAVNNEIGSINPIHEIGAICTSNKIIFMVDAIQAFGKIKINPEKSGISLLSFSGHKIYGPKGIGGLYIREGLELSPQIHGGGQEYGVRSGTENVMSILALAKASELAHNEMGPENNRIKNLRDYFLKRIIEIEPNIVVNGSINQRISNNLNIGFPHVDSGALLKNLNKLGINVSLGSACSSGKIGESHVLLAIGADTKNYGSIRFSFGLNTTKVEIDYVIRQLYQIIPHLKEKK
ncbi:cysteine desulfurase family protein [Paenibacillus senegalimassiliensis]|uniref:cysteine desulfurase family protein n=1 Tax=Paenibacillus senegalimassiliensis TaxID=1737426 RepID=UPI00073F497B|nr:cysteine desulfurase family protein [Paenibacillus senegalimassiliensis]